MAGIVAAVSREKRNVVPQLYDAGRLSQNRGTGGYIIKLGNYSLVHENDVLPFSTGDHTYNGIKSLNGSSGICFVTKNIKAKERLIESDFFLDGYLKNPEKILEHPEANTNDAYVAMEKILGKFDGDLYEMGEFFSKHARGLGVLKTKDGFIAMRDKNGFRTGWFGEDSKSDLQLLVQENYIFDEMGIKKYREIRQGETLKVTQRDERSGVINGSNLIFDVQEVVDGLHPETFIFGKSVYSHRVGIGESLARSYADQIKRKDGEEIMVFDFPDGPRPAALGFSRELNKIKGNTNYEEFYFKKRDSHVSDQQRRFDLNVERKFEYYPNGTFVRGLDGSSESVMSPIKGKVGVGVDDCIITATNAINHSSILDKFGAVGKYYVSMEVPVFYGYQVGYFTIKKDIFASKLLDEIKLDKIRTIRQVNEKLKEETKCDVFCNDASSLAGVIFSNSGLDKENLAIPPEVRDMPFE